MGMASLVIARPRYRVLETALFSDSAFSLEKLWILTTH